MTELKGNIVDIHSRRIFPALLIIEGTRIRSITEISEIQSQYILPGFVDAHVHIESSMLIPTEFSRLCLPHGTIATISDPHEIANVLGMDGISFMIENEKHTPLRILYGAPSCVPATHFETAGAEIGVSDIEKLMAMDEIGYLSEMMNYPGVLHKDPLVMEKIAVAQRSGKPIDGHAPGLRGLDAESYCNAGISTDHECFTLDEALEKIQYGMSILIREGSAAKNFEELHPLIASHPDLCMFCSDDKHPDELAKGHINQIVARAIAKGYNLMDVLRIAHLNPKVHYNLDIGSLQIGDFADFIICDDLVNIIPNEVYVKGNSIAKNGKVIVDIPSISIIPNSPCNIQPISVQDLQIPAISNKVNVIGCIPGQLTTNTTIAKLSDSGGYLTNDPLQDIIKISVINRYTSSPPALAFVQGIGLNKGAIASTIAHDSHNIISVGADDESMCKAINALIECKGGIAYADATTIEILPLPIAGLMSDKDGYMIAEEYEKIDLLARNAGSNINAPFMTLSFLALLVIPTLKLSDKGLFNGESFTFTSLYAD